MQATSTTREYRWVWLAPLAALAIGYAIGMWHRGFVHAPIQTAARIASPSPANHPRATTLQRAALATTGAAHLPPIPADGLPLAQSFDALAARARGGDVAAAVRLLDETTHCAQGQHEVTLLQQPDPTLTLPNDTPQAQWWYARSKTVHEQAVTDVASTQELCADVGAAQIASAGEWLDRATAGDDPGAEACYALGQDLYAPPKYSDGWVDWMRDYRVHATPYAEQALAAGWPQAASYLFDAYAGPYAAMHYDVDPNLAPNLARAYALALFQSERLQDMANELGPGELSMWTIRARLMEDELSPAQIAEAHVWADAEMARMGDAPAPVLPCHGVFVR